MLDEEFDKKCSVSGTKILIATSDFWFPGRSIYHEVVVIRIGDDMIKIRGTKKIFWLTFHKELWIYKSDVREVLN